MGLINDLHEASNLDSLGSCLKCTSLVAKSPNPPEPHGLYVAFGTQTFLVPFMVEMISFGTQIGWFHPLPCLLIM
jgi:hypothetical protein